MAAVLLTLPACDDPVPSQTVAGTSLVACVLADLGIPEQSVYVLVPPRTCPGHFDLKPSDVARVASGDRIVIHPWQREAANVARVLEAARVPDQRVTVVEVDGNWMTPPVHAKVLVAVAQALSEADPSRGEEYKRKAEERAAAVAAFAEQMQRRLGEAEVAEVNVLCSAQQAPFVEWAGFKMAATFGRPEELSVADVEVLIRRAREDNVALVIDNLQSGDVQLGAAIAREAGAVHVVLSNFPGGFDNTDTWERAVHKNVDLLLGAVKRRRSDG